MVKKQNKPDKEYRSFKIVGSSIGFQGGKFVSATPSGAGKKAAGKLWRLLKEEKFAKVRSDTEKSNLIEFIMRETTIKSKHKIFSYASKKMKLTTPKVRTLPGGNTYTIDSEVSIRALKENEFSPAFRNSLAGGYWLSDNASPLQLGGD